MKELNEADKQAMITESDLSKVELEDVTLVDGAGSDTGSCTH